ncbi:hypothetical protein [Pleionea litopenaei]|uniref:Uncharacterized protein n=1 Tax=Pleionea litopenaei TaxID=3070815 RepID=A0AA51RW81_9GAMM|nr:hypothetical protein [Pleionea sp. HL-JVS1]WMS88801.1 hypothetical protein Q9312_07745 [Pleionea sp. HL-JVS1]
MNDLSLGCADSYPVHDVYTFSDDIERIRVCDHDFEPAIDVHEPAKDGWHGFCLMYHCNLEWCDTEFKIEDLDELIVLLETGAEKAQPSYFDRENCYSLIVFLKEAKSKNRSVSVLKE